MKKSYIIVLAIIFIAFGLAYRYSDSDMPNRKKIVRVSSQELLQQEIQQKIERRKSGYAKKDKPDKFVAYLNSRSLKDGISGYAENNKIKEMKSAMARKAMLKSTTTSLSWVQRGPGNVGGRTRAILVDPDDPTQNTWFAGAVSGGIWKTINAGDTWEIISPNLPNLATVSLAMAPSNSNVIYAGTGEGYYNVDAVRGDGIFKSTDKGQSWTQISKTINTSYFHYVNSIVVSPSDENILWVGSNRGLMKSLDAGDSWSLISPVQDKRYQKLIIHPSNENILWVTVNGIGIYKTENGGEDWFLVSDMTGVGRIELTISKSNPDVLYAMDSESKLYFSQDGGYEWAEGIESGTATEFLSGQGWYNNALAVDPTNPNKGFIGGLNLSGFTLGAEVSDPGRIAYQIELSSAISSFMDFNHFEGNYLKGGLKIFSAYSNLYENIELQFGSGQTQKAHRLNYSPAGGTYSYNIKDDIENLNYLGYVEVPFKAVNTSTGKQLDVSFIDFNENGKFDLYEGGYEVVIVHDDLYDDVNADVNISSTNGNYRVLFALFPTLPQGAVWDDTTLPVCSIAINAYQLKNRVLSARLLSSWSVSNTTSNYSHADHHNITIVEGKGNPYSLIVGNDGGIGYSSDGGTTWNSKSNSYVTSQFYGISRHPSEYMYFGGLQDNGSYISGLNPAITSSWTELLGGDGFDVVWHSRQPNKLIGSIYYNGLWRSEDGGYNWSDIQSFIGDNDDTSAPFLTKIASSKVDPDLLFVGGKSGLWKSTNFGTNWKNIPMGDYWGYDDYASPKITISEADPQIVWAGNQMTDNTNSTAGNIFVSTDKGDSFTAIDNIMDLGSVSNIITHPNDPETAYVLFSFSGYPKIFRTTDLGQTWEDISGFVEDMNNIASYEPKLSSNGFPNVAINTLLVMPFDDQEIWAGTEIGLFISYNNGVSWEYSDNGIPAVSIWDMKVVGDEIIVGTHGLGVWSVKRTGLSNEFKMPYLDAIGINPQGNIVLKSLLDVNYDSIEIFNGDLLQVKRIDILTGDRVDTVYAANLGTSSNITMSGYINGVKYMSNTKLLPQNDLLEPVVNYYNNFSTNFDDFVGDGFAITQGVLNNNAIQTAHPYAQNQDIYYTFKHPIIVSQDASMAFIDYMDIAFLETGEDGIDYPDVDFYDYAVVEATKDGIHWVDLDAGYDFNFSATWAKDGTTYHSTPDESYFVSHRINLLNTFAANDTILIRFKLHSDPFETGWGWAIDNVYVQEEPSAIFNTKDVEFDLTLYPNPAETYFNITIDDPYMGDVEISIIAMNGKIIAKNNYFKGSGHFIQNIQLENIQKGNYIVNVKMNGDQSAEILLVD